MQENERFSTLRTLLLEPPSKGLWERVWEYLERWPEEERLPAIQYAEGHMQHWPDELRSVSADQCLYYIDDPQEASPFLLGRRVLFQESDHLIEAFVSALEDDVYSFGHLTELDLSHCSMGDDMLIRMLYSQHFPALRVLILDGNTLGEEGIAILANAPELQDLHTLSLSGNRLDETAAASLAASPYIRKLRTLDVSLSSPSLT